MFTHSSLLRLMLLERSYCERATEMMASKEKQFELGWNLRVKTLWLLYENRLRLLFGLYTYEKKENTVWVRYLKNHRRRWKFASVFSCWCWTRNHIHFFLSDSVRRINKVRWLLALWISCVLCRSKWVHVKVDRLCALGKSNFWSRIVYIHGKHFLQPRFGGSRLGLH